MKRDPTLSDMRRHAIAASLKPYSSLGRAVAGMGFVQADPIRAPARAQDLILRHRVDGYRAGDLERKYARLRIEEDYLYAYGFMPVAVADLLHPRHDPQTPGGRHKPDGLAADVLAFVAARGRTHPADLEATFGRTRAVNGWGQFSKATTRALHLLQHHGYLRVAGRRDGIRTYEAMPERSTDLSPAERARRIVRLIVALHVPVSEAGLGRTFGLLNRGAPGLGPFRSVVADLLREGALRSTTIEGETYLWPAGRIPGFDDGPSVRLLAPFDPIVWERRRFEHLWGWDYRLEAYTPPKKRRFGYYALPLLWRDAVIGWANVRQTADGLDVETGFVGKAPRGTDFRRALDEELARLEVFLGPPKAGPYSAMDID